MNFFAKTTVALAAASVSLLVGGIAHAQDANPITNPDANPVTNPVAVSRPFSVKVGGFFPRNGTVRDTIGKNLFSAGVVFDVTKSRLITPLILSVFVDYTDRRRGNTHNQLTYTNVGVQGRILLASANAPVGFPYLGGGVGASFIRVRTDNSGTTRKTVILGKLLAGYELRCGIFGEAEYLFIGKVNKQNTSGTNIRLGYRF